MDNAEKDLLLRVAKIAYSLNGETIFCVKELTPEMRKYWIDKIDRIEAIIEEE